MKKSLLAVCAAVCLAAMSSPCVLAQEGVPSAGNSTNPSAGNREAIEKAIRDLDSYDPEIRKKAVQDILSFGSSARQIISEHLKADNLTASQKFELEAIEKELESRSYLEPSRVTLDLQNVPASEIETILRDKAGYKGLTPWEAFNPAISSRSRMRELLRQRNGQVQGNIIERYQVENRTFLESYLDFFHFGDRIDNIHEVKKIGYDDNYTSIHGVFAAVLFQISTTKTIIQQNDPTISTVLQIELLAEPKVRVLHGQIKELVLVLQDGTEVVSDNDKSLGRFTTSGRGQNLTLNHNIPSGKFSGQYVTVRGKIKVAYHAGDQTLSIPVSELQQTIDLGNFVLEKMKLTSATKITNQVNNMQYQLSGNIAVSGAKDKLSELGLDISVPGKSPYVCFTITNSDGPAYYMSGFSTSGGSFNYLFTPLKFFDFNEEPNHAEEKLIITTPKHFGVVELPIEFKNVLIP